MHEGDRHDDFIQLTEVINGILNGANEVSHSTFKVTLLPPVENLEATLGNWLDDGKPWIIPAKH